jgi:hypothetical protein
VSTATGVKQPYGTPPLPTSIWVVAWASLAGQVAQLLWRGSRTDDEVSVLVSVVLGALVLGYLSSGVVRARTVRSVLVLVVLVVAFLAEVIGVLSADEAGEAALDGVALLTTTVTLAALARFRRTDWYAWQRTRPPAHLGASTKPLVAVGVLVGVLGGLIGPLDDGVDVQVRVADR